MINHGLSVYSDNLLTNNLIELNSHNSKIIENEIKNSRDYRFEFAKKIFEYYGGSDYFKSDSLDKGRKREAFYAVLRMIDRDNSTNVWFKENNKNALEAMVDYIVNNLKKFLIRLKDGDISLVDDLMKEGKKKDDNCHLSFSSKVCKYLNCWIFNNDDYFIYDYYVKESIPFYLDYFGENNKTKELYVTYKLKKNKCNGKDYSDFYNLMTKIMELRDKYYGNKSKKLTKNELDHIIWGSYHRFAQN